MPGNAITDPTERSFQPADHQSDQDNHKAAERGISLSGSFWRPVTAHSAGQMAHSRAILGDSSTRITRNSIVLITRLYTEGKPASRTPEEIVRMIIAPSTEAKCGAPHQHRDQHGGGKPHQDR